MAFSPSGATRGDGEHGDDVTHNLRTVRDLPLRLHSRQSAGPFEVRGEIYMTREDLVRVNNGRKKAGHEPYANPRNLAAGSLKLLDPKLCAQRRLRLFAYGHGACRRHRVACRIAAARAVAPLGLPGQSAHGVVRRHREGH